MGPPGRARQRHAARRHDGRAAALIDAAHVEQTQDVGQRSLVWGHLQQFRTSFNALLQHLFAAGVRVVHIHPAIPLSASIEIGRMLLPKTFEEVHVWEWQAPDWKQALRLK